MPETKKSSYAYVILACCCVIMFFGMGWVYSCAGVFYTPLMKELNCQMSDLSLSGAIMNLTMLVCIPMATKLLSKYNPRYVIGIAFLIQYIGYAAKSQMTAVWQLWVISMFFGMASSVITFMAVPTLVNAWFQERVGFFMTFPAVFTSLGGILGNYAGTFFTERFGVMAAQIWMAGIGLVIGIPTIFLLVRAKPADIGQVPLGAGKAVGTGGVIDQSGVPAKVAFRSPAFYLTLGFAALVMVVANLIAYIPSYAVTLGFTATFAATCASATTGGRLVTQLCIGTIIDKLGVKIAAWGCAACGIVGCLILLFIPSQTTVLIGCVLIGVSITVYSACPPMVTRKHFGLHSYNQIYSKVSMANSLLSALAMVIYGVIIDSSGYAGCFWLVALTLAGGCVCLGSSFASAKKLTWEKAPQEK